MKSFRSHFMVGHNFYGAFVRRRRWWEFVPCRWCRDITMVLVELGGALGGSKEEPNLDRNLMKKRQGGREAAD